MSKCLAVLCPMRPFSAHRLFRVLPSLQDGLCALMRVRGLKAAVATNIAFVC